MKLDSVLKSWPPCPQTIGRAVQRPHAKLYAMRALTTSSTASRIFYRFFGQSSSALHPENVHDELLHSRHHLVSGIAIHILLKLLTTTSAPLMKKSRSLAAQTGWLVKGRVASL